MRQVSKPFDLTPPPRDGIKDESAKAIEERDHHQPGAKNRGRDAWDEAGFHESDKQRYRQNHSEPKHDAGNRPEKSDRPFGPIEVDHRLQNTPAKIGRAHV